MKMMIVGMASVPPCPYPVSGPGEDVEDASDVQEHTACSQDVHQDLLLDQRPFLLHKLISPDKTTERIMNN